MDYLIIKRQWYWYGAIALVLVVVVGLGIFDHVRREQATSTVASSTNSIEKADLSLTVSPKQNGSASAPAESTQLEAGAAGASVVAPPPGPTPSQLVPGCSLHFSFQPSVMTIEPQGTINYTATASNFGESTCNNVSFSVYYAANETYLSSSPKPTASNYYWNLGNLASAASETIQISTEATPAAGDTEIDNQACATGDNASDVCPQNTIFIGTAPVAAASQQESTPAATPSATLTASEPPSGVWGAAFDTKELGIWVWDTPLEMSSTYEADALATASQNGFNTIYLTVDDYVPIAALANGTTKTAKQNAYFAALTNFVKQANAYGIAVYAEGGSPDWSEPANQWKGFALIDFVQAYNRAYPNAQVKGLQYDVESYLLPAYNTNETEVLTDFIQFIDTATTKMALENPGAHFEVVIPHFYDSEIAWTPSIEYDGTNAYTYTHLLQILQRIPGSALVDMAYRNTFTGSNGTEALVDAEITQAAAGGYSTRVIVAQETGNVQPSYVTFYGLSKNDLYQELAQISSTFGGYSSYGGMAIDYLDPFLALH